MTNILMKVIFHKLYLFTGYSHSPFPHQQYSHLQLGWDKSMERGQMECVFNQYQYQLETDILSFIRKSDVFCSSFMKPLILISFPFLTVRNQIRI